MLQIDQQYGLQYQLLYNFLMNMYLQKQEIKATKFYPQQKPLSILFDNKKIEQFINQIEKIKEKKEKISPFALQKCEHFKQIQKKNQRAMEILRSPKTGWKINKIDNKTELAVRVTGTNVQLRYEGILSANIQNLCIMIYQVNNFHQWVPFCTKGQDLAEISPIQKLCFLTFKMPFLTQRYAYFYALGMDKIDHNGTVVIYGEGITENEEMMKKFNIVPDKKKIDKLVVMDIKFFICEISYKCYSQIDSRMPILPEWLVNTVIKQMGGFIFDKIIKQSQKFKGSIWQKTMIQDKNNPFYNWLQKRMQYWHEINRKQKINSKI